MSNLAANPAATPLVSLKSAWKRSASLLRRNDGVELPSLCGVGSSNEAVVLANFLARSADDDFGPEYQPSRIPPSARSRLLGLSGALRLRVVLLRLGSGSSMAFHSATLSPCSSRVGASRFPVRFAPPAHTRSRFRPIG